MATRRKTNSRADTVRSRKKQSSRPKGKNPRSQVDTLDRRMPPVMVRGSSYGTARKTRKKGKKKTIKRRYDIPLPTPGASGVEVRLPSLPVMKVNWRTFSFLVAVGLVFFLYYLLTAPVFQVQDVDVQGLLRLTVGEIQQSLNIVNKSVFSLNPRELEQVLDDDFAELKDISVQIGLPSRIIISVNERVPLIEWVQDTGVNWIDGEGFAFPRRGEAENLVTVLAYAPPPSPVPSDVEAETLELLPEYQVFMSQDLVNAILTMSPQAPEGTELVYDPSHGLGWRDVNGWDVYFGWNGENIEMKLHVYRAIAQKMKVEGITPTLINVEHVHAPYYRMER